jgi:nucleoside phosphorylase
VSILDDTDRKQLFAILLNHPLIATAQRRQALLDACHLEYLVQEVDSHQDAIYDFVIVLLAHLIKTLATSQPETSTFVSVLNYLLDFSRPTDLTQDDLQFLQRLIRKYKRKPAKKRLSKEDSLERTSTITEKQIPLSHDHSQEEQLEQKYLRQVIASLEWLEITGLPAGLIAQSAPLDEIFIPLQFRPNRPLTEYPLTERELATYYQSLREQRPRPDLERIIFDAERSWSTTTQTGKTILLPHLWQHLTKERPAAVIQGHPGAGKSTLLRYLALSMARYILPQNTTTEPLSFTPTLVPFLISLGDFVHVCAEKPDLSLSDYLLLLLEHPPGSDFRPLLTTCLEAGRALILLDGLDEVSDLGMRRHIQHEIKQFISYANNSMNETQYFNRFLVTSRVAGYDQGAFPAYPHYTIAELTLEQIEDFLPRWCRAIVRLDPIFSLNNQGNQTALFEQETERRTEALRVIIRKRPELQTLVENPLLLTLLALMQQNQIEVPRQRVDLYRIFTQALLERRSDSTGTPLIPETQAFSRLGPIALHMQETSNGFLHTNEVLASLLTTISLEKEPTSAQQEAEAFLYKIRVHAGIFLLRAGDYYAFIHRTFQEYFVARFLLSTMALDEKKVLDYTNKVCQDYTIWREPFLLAVAYASSKNIPLANKLISTLLTVMPDINTENHLLRLQIATECLIEARPTSIDPVLERHIAIRLLQYYEQSQQHKQFERCLLIEDLVQKWLASIPEHTHYATLWDVLLEAISTSQSMSYQRAVLTLLAIVIESLMPSPSSFLIVLIPPLFSLAELPAIGPYEPTSVSITPFDVISADLALISLSLLRMQGPAGLLPATIRQHFVTHPDQLSLLAQHSVASNTLLTPTLIPRKDEFSYHWPGDTLLRQWLLLHNDYTDEEKLQISLTIHQGLLDCSEEMRYPFTLHILQILKRTHQLPASSWQQIWQDYLTDQMNSGHYVSYQECALFWCLLFPEMQELEKLVTILLEHLDRDGTPAQRSAERFLATLGDNLRVQEELQEIGEIDDGSFLQQLRFWLDIREVLYIQDRQNLRYWRYLRDMHNLQYLRNIQGDEPLHNPEPIRTLQHCLFTPTITQHCIARLAVLPFGQDEYLDVLTILLGRILSLWAAGIHDDAVTDEVAQIVQAMRVDIPPIDNDERSAILLDILRYMRFLSIHLSVHTAQEALALQQLREKTNEEWLQQMCEASLQQATPEILNVALLLKAERETLPETKAEPSVYVSSYSSVEEPEIASVLQEVFPHIIEEEHSSNDTTTILHAIQDHTKQNDDPPCDVCIVCAMSEEANTFMNVAEDLSGKKFQTVFGSQTKRMYRSITIENRLGETLSVYITCLPSYGPQETGLHLKPMLTELQPRFAAMTGICAGDREKVVLGDIIVAEHAFLSDTGKFILDRKGQKKQSIETRTWSTHQNVLQFVRLFDTWKASVSDLKRPISKRQQRDWLLSTLLQSSQFRIDNIPLAKLQRNAPVWKKIMHELQAGSRPYLTRDRVLINPEKIREELSYGKNKFPYRDPKRPACHVAPMASGSAVRSDNPFEEIRIPVRSTIAVDMEGAVFYRTIADFPGLHSLLVKGVSDYADPDKDDSYHEYAATVSAKYILVFIQEYVTKALPRAFQP